MGGLAHDAPDQGEYNACCSAPSPPTDLAALVAA